MSRTPSGRSKPECAHRMRASGSCRYMRSIASTSECTCRISLNCFASAIMRFGTGRSASAAIEVELADRRRMRSAQAFLEEVGDGVVAHPGGDVAAGAVRSQRRYDEVGRFGHQPLRAFVAGTRDHRAVESGLAQDRDRRLGGRFPTRRGCSARARRRSAGRRRTPPSRTASGRNRASVRAFVAYLRGLIAGCQARTVRRAAARGAARIRSMSPTTIASGVSPSRTTAGCSRRSASKASSRG